MNPYAAFRFPEFRFLVSANFLLTMAGMIQEVAVGYEVYRMTHDPLALGMIGLVEAVPFMSLTLFGGHIADMYSKRKVLIWSVGGIAFSSIALQVVSGCSIFLACRRFLLRYMRHCS